MSGGPTGRRSLLRRAAATTIAVAGGVAVLPSPPDEPRADVAGAAEASVPWDGPIESEAATPVARFQYARVGEEYVPTSPINVVFPLSDVDAGLAEVMAVLEDAGWIRRPEEYVRYARDRESGSYVLQEATAAQTYYGTSGRLHVRCWEFEGVVSMQAHEDGGARPKHAVSSYERARDAIASVYAASDWAISRGLDLANDEEPDHDGLAVAIRPEGSP